MLKVGLSGKIASGKSEVEKILRDLGYLVFDLDKISREIFEREIIQKLIFEEFKTLDRKEIAKIIFEDLTKKEKLEGIIYPFLKDYILDLFEKYSSEKAIFISGALLFKSGFYKLFDKTIFIDASEKIRLERLIKRDDLTLELAQKRLNIQDDGTFADFVIENNLTTFELEKSLRSVLKNMFNN